MDLEEMTDAELAVLSERIREIQERRRSFAEAEARAEEIKKRAEDEMQVIAVSYLTVRDGMQDEDNPAPWVQPTGAHDAYPEGWLVSHGEKMWRSLHPNNVHEPGVSGWREVVAGGIAIWVQPTGAHDAYQYGDMVMHNGLVYTSTRDNNVWEPGTSDSGWELVDEPVEDDPPPADGPQPPEVPDPEDPEPEPDPEPDVPEGYVGPWDKDTRYEVGDVTSKDGRYYRCKIAHGSEYQGTWAPPAHSVWDDIGSVA